MTDFESIKKFFVERIDKFVYYKVFGKEEILNGKYAPDFVIQNILRNSKVKDFFGIEFPNNAPTDLICIDSMDSFVFDFYLLELENEILLTDANRTFECGVEAFEGNKVIFNKIGVVEKYLNYNGVTNSEFEILKQTSIDTFVEDTINFVKVLQTLNNAQPYPPYLLELDSAKELVDALTCAWVKNENLSFDKNSRKLAVFDNYKGVVENICSYENSYLDCFNKHAFVGVFVNRKGEVLIRKNLNSKSNSYDFAISDFVLDNEENSLIGLQRAIENCFGFEFYFGEIAPAVTITKNKIITDFYLVNNYEVPISDLSFDKTIVEYFWVSKNNLLSLINKGEFKNYSATFIEYLYETIN